MTEVDWDSLTKAQREHLYQSRRDLEVNLTNLVVEFEKETNLPILSMNFRRWYPPRDIGDGLEVVDTSPHIDGVFVDVQVPMRIYPYCPCSEHRNE